MASATGMIEVEGVGGIIVAADAACKAAMVELTGWESIGGFTTLFVRGTTGDVDAAVRAGAEAARTFVDHVVEASMHQPVPETAEFVGVPAAGVPAARKSAHGVSGARARGGEHRQHRAEARNRREGWASST